MKENVIRLRRTKKTPVATDVADAADKIYKITRWMVSGFPAGGISKLKKFKEYKRNYMI